MAAGPRRRGWWRSSGEHSHGVGAYRARLADTGGSGGLLEWRWSYCGGDGVARRELAHGYGDGGAAGARRLLLALRNDEGGARKTK